ncbi:uncharacterized protein LOC110988825 isoform X2 [Acanthaster planci]|uniref:Uncharacterized protein LOC110988825 isoform X2 n=1 Tax=Acanthaster planci TaxID=133434 RepID=A0A8B7ZS49_ACAPL|nr:uncharacterized protein LOC110988825 isoform X2 [Acanthaster planci]
MTQTLSRKRNRDLEDSELLPSPKRTDFNFNSSPLLNGHSDGNEEPVGSSRYSETDACFNGQPTPTHSRHCPVQQATPSMLLQHTNNHSLPLNHPPNSKNETYLDSSTCTALSNLHLIPGDHTEVPSCSHETLALENSIYRDINRVLREAHFSRLSRLNGAFRE